jgi:hypothetical protein
MRLLILAAGAALALAACGSNNDANNNASTDLEVGNLIVNDGSMTATTDMNAMNATMNSAETQNAVANDLTHNDADTNLANGQ